MDIDKLKKELSDKYELTYHNMYFNKDHYVYFYIYGNEIKLSYCVSEYDGDIYNIELKNIEDNSDII